MPLRSVSKVLLAVSALVLGGASPAPAAPEEPLRYVAMGDSYSAGSGVLPLDPTASPLCARTSRDYGHLIAAELAQVSAVDFTDVTCGGATTADYSGAQYLGVAPQYDALTADTDLVTMTIGGNDGGLFVSMIAACGAAGATTLGFGNPCERIWGDHWVTIIKEQTRPAVEAALAGVHERSPQARVAILGYPDIMPETVGCFGKMPIARGDVPYVHDIQDQLNAAVRQAAAATGTTYVDVPKASAGHDACAPIGERWVEPALFGTNFVPVHPNATGLRRMAEITSAKLGL